MEEVNNVLFSIGPLEVTRPVVTMWVIIAVLAVVCFLATRNLKDVPGPLQTLAGCIINQAAAIGFPALDHIAEKLQRIHHSIVVERDIVLVTVHVRPELRPSAIFILSVKQVGHTPAETSRISGVGCRLIEPGQESHLRGGGAVVDGRVVATAFVGQDARHRLGCQPRLHVGVLRPAAGHTLIGQNLIAGDAGFFGLVECSIGVSHVAAAELRRKLKDAQAYRGQQGAKFSHVDYLQRNRKFGTASKSVRR